MHQLVMFVSRKIGIMGKFEELDPLTFKTKIIFVTAQLMYTFVTIYIASFLYSNYTLSIIYIVLIFGKSFWTGCTDWTDWTE